MVYAEGSYLIFPPSLGGNMASQEKPCPGLGSSIVVTTEIQLSREIRIEFDIRWSSPPENETETKHILYLVEEENVNGLESFSPNSPQVILYFLVNTTKNSTLVDFGHNERPRFHILQYRFGEYRSCSRLKFLAAPPPGAARDQTRPGIFIIEGGYFDANTGTFHCNKGWKLVNYFSPF